MQPRVTDNDWRPGAPGFPERREKMSPTAEDFEALREVGDIAKALATRLEKALVVSVMEQFKDPGPVWALPLNDDEVAMIVSALRGPVSTSGTGNE